MKKGNEFTRSWLPQKTKLRLKQTKSILQMPRGRGGGKTLARITRCAKIWKINTERDSPKSMGSPRSRYRIFSMKASRKTGLWTDGGQPSRTRQQPNQALHRTAYSLRSSFLVCPASGIR